MELSKIREYVLTQIGDTKALGSKKFPKRTQQKIIRLCTPIIREHYRAVARYSDYKTFTTFWDEDYVNDRGEFTSVEWYGGNAQFLEFRYEDAMMGNYYAVDVKMPISWLDDDSIEKYEDEVSSSIIDEINGRINILQDEICELRKKRETIKRRKR